MEAKSEMGRIVGLVLQLILNRLMDVMGLKYDQLLSLEMI